MRNFTSKGIIYLVSNTTGDKYIGQTTGHPLTRWGDHIKNIVAGKSPFGNKTPITDWSFRILEVKEVESRWELDSLEMFWVEKEKSNLNTPKIFSRDMKAARNKKVIELLEQGLSYRKISAITDVCLGTIGRINNTHRLAL